MSGQTSWPDWRTVVEADCTSDHVLLAGPEILLRILIEDRQPFTSKGYCKDVDAWRSDLTPTCMDGEVVQPATFLCANLELWSRHTRWYSVRSKLVKAINIRQADVCRQHSKRKE